VESKSKINIAILCSICKFATYPLYKLLSNSLFNPVVIAIHTKQLPRRDKKLSLIDINYADLLRLIDKDRVRIINEKKQLYQIEQELAASKPDIGVLLCFPYRVEKNIISIPNKGFINLHPSLLPANRGPDPIFWTLYYGDRETGVTVHKVTEELDEGPIILQQKVNIPVGTSYLELEDLCARIGADLLEAAIANIDTLIPMEQNEELATYNPFPKSENLVVSPDWTAERAFRFLRGIEGVWLPSISGVFGSIPVLKALEYTQEPMGEEIRSEDSTVLVRFRDGAVRIIPANQ